uniref:CD209 antigen-like protein E n=1 Tax=Poecilia reticulata TaxID=8081 RepID=A0A3P9NJD3_POERE
MLFLFEEIHLSQSKTSNQIQEEGSSAVKQSCVCASKFANGREATFRSRKTIYLLSSVAMLSLSIVAGQFCSDLFEGERCLKKRPEWEKYRESLYYFSTQMSSWTDSRRSCIDLGSDLVKIDSREEQTFLVEKLKTKILHPEDKFWIGLTDSKKEGSWLWVDGSPLDKRLSFWFGTEPDNWSEKNKDGEDCVRMGKHDVTDLECWYDQSCLAPQKSICEKHWLMEM